MSVRIDSQGAEQTLGELHEDLWRTVFIRVLHDPRPAARIGRAVGGAGAGYGLGWGMDKLYEWFTGNESTLGRWLVTPTVAAASAFSPEVIQIGEALGAMTAQQREEVIHATSQMVLSRDYVNCLALFGLGPEVEAWHFAQVARHRINYWHPDNHPPDMTWECVLNHVILTTAANKLAEAYGYGILPI